MVLLFNEIQGYQLKSLGLSGWGGEVGPGHRELSGTLKQRC